LFFQLLMKQTVVELGNALYAGVNPACVFLGTSFDRGKSVSASPSGLAFPIQHDTNDSPFMTFSACLDPGSVLVNGVEAFLINIDTISVSWEI
jgi:hypothetical protein